MSAFRAGAIGLIAVSIGIYLGFAKDIPFTNNPYELKAVFTDAQNLSTRSPVRIAGVEVGEVVKVEAAGDGSTQALVTMKIRDKGLPIRSDAQAKIRPRIFLEGNFFVDLKPGTPHSREVDSGFTVPVSQTSAPVQIDQVLTSLQSDTRADLQTLVEGYGDALNGEPEPGEDDDQDESTQGETAAEALNDSLDTAAPALRGVSIVNDATLGTELHDLSRLIRGQQKVSTALVSREESLKSLISNFNTTMAAFAAEQGNLRQTIHLLPEVLEQAGPAFDHLNESFPATRAFAREILPGVRETPATIAAAFPWIEQTRKLVSPAELQGLVNDLRPAIDDLAEVTDNSIRLFPRIDLVNRCFLDVILPTGDYKIQGPPGYPHKTDVANYKEFWQSQVGLASESQNFDGNGQYTRFQPGGGDQMVSTGKPGTGGDPLFANTAFQPLGTVPKMPDKRPPYVRNVDCHKNKPPDLDSAQIGGGP